MTDARPSLLPHASLYAGSRDQSGMEVITAPIVKAWGGWPSDVEPTLRLWNKQGRLSFVLTRLLFKCPECSRFIDSRGVAGSRLDDVFICDDCLVAIVRDA